MTTCHDDEGWSLVSRQRDFDITPCTEEGIFLTATLAIYLVIALGRSIVLRCKSPKDGFIPSAWLLVAKLVFLAAAVGLSIANIVYISITRTRVPFVTSYILEALAFVASMVLTVFNHKRTRTSSTTILLFWPLYTIEFAIWTRTMVMKDFDTLTITLKGSAIAFGLISFLFECVGPQYPQQILDPKEHPVLTANIYSIWSFSWMTPLMKKGAAQYITEKDLPGLPPNDEAANLGSALYAALKNHPLWRALFIAYGWEYFIAGILKVFQDVLIFAQPQLLRMLLAYIARYQSSRFGRDFGILEIPSPTEGFAIVVLMFISSIVVTIALHQYFQRCFETGMRVRAGLTTVIYKKALVLSSSTHGRATGDIVNLMSVDSTRLQDFCTYGFVAISAPLQIALAFISLYSILGWSAFVGVAIMIVSIPLQTLMARYLKGLQVIQMKSRDKRTRLMSEILANIKSIKLYAWEFAFVRRVLSVRNDQELQMLQKIGIVTSLNVTLWIGIPLLVAFASFATAAVVLDTPLTSDIIFPSISLFMLLQFPLGMFSQVISSVIEAIVSLNRLSEFLAAEELQPDARTITINPNLKHGDEVLSIKNGDFKWDQSATTATLEDINMSVKKGELVAVLGRVGAGKTSLINAIIGDMTKTEGEVIISGTVSYASQNPWILSASVRENITFGHEYDEEFYELVLDACALRHDLSLLPQGDLTEVGEKGITLSGGQRARVSLARAIYARADLVLLDDVLAAVDSHVARHVFDHVIGSQGLLRNKARILVTNSISFLKSFDQLFYIRHGIILESGSYEHLTTEVKGAVYDLIQGHGHASSTSGTSTPMLRSDSATPQGTESPKSENAKSDLLSDLARISASLQRRGSFRRAVLLAPGQQTTESKGLSVEHTEQGRVKTDVYTRYIKAASRIGFTFYIITIIAQQATSVLANFALRDWGESNRYSGNDRMMYFLFLYGIFSLSSTLLSCAGSITLWVYCGIRSARSLHDSMLDAVMRAPLSFFELTPTGRILNLFSRDTYVVDQVIARVMSGFFRTLATCVSIVAIISGVFPPFLIAVIPLTWFYYRVMKYYLSTSRELKRLDAVSKSPIFAWFSESLAGLTTIRAYGHQDIFSRRNEARVDRNQMCYLPSISVNRWLATRLEFVGALIILITSSLAMVALMTTGVDAGLVGLVLSYALNATSSLNWFVRSASEVETNIVSAERILHYVELAPEAPAEIPDAKPPGNWPTEGRVEFKNYSTRYRPELDLILKDVSFSINASEKIGICGRTGAGKSSLLLALFRIIEAAEGSIFIDGVDISKIGLHDLRSNISIVPQSPDLFEGTLRENIDPVGEHPDADIWVALEQAHLKEYVETLPDKLDAPVKEGGMSLSAGQRQLLCFARALLRKSKILVLDEATSAVDLDTDRAIQQIISGPDFKDVTMFTIAHRLNTILGSDRVMVLDSGKIAELDTPQNLLADKGTIFYSLAAEAGLAGSAAPSTPNPNEA